MESVPGANGCTNGVSSVSNNKDTPKERLRNHKLTPTCICIDSRNKFAFTGSKDGTVIKWCLENRKILNKINSISRKHMENEEKKLQEKHHHKHINCIAISSDDKFLATGGWDKSIRIWSPVDLSWIHTFSKHRQEVTALAFRIGFPLLYSGSADRSVMLWTLEDDDNRCFVDDLYGHESPITSIDILRKDRVLTSGGRDQTIRIWKIVEQSQNVFESKHQSVDIARFIDDKTFVTGGEDGSILIWSTMKRKFVLQLSNAHPMQLSHESTPETTKGYTKFDQKGLKSWISALATYVFDKDKQNGRKRMKLNNGEKSLMVHDDPDESGDASDGDSSSSEDEELEANNCSDSKDFALVASGSCNSEIRVWIVKKSSGKFSMKLAKTFTSSGFVNDLRFTSDGKKLLAAIGQEHRLGRWWTLKNAKNRLDVFDTSDITS